ncbi:MAG TPA: Nif3-like dinuclear metal center hexameric protein [Chitinophagaceae bacterium]|nr:Nif3-like dinuclear metal center hexameric protein [Chitinophagaceae bacterium]
MKIIDVINVLESIAPPSLQEDYDNAGLLTGNPDDDCTGIITTLDVTEEIVVEALRKKCNLIVAHHPVIFRGIKKLTGKNYVERTLIAAIKNDLSIYAIHTNLDNVLSGVNKKIAEKLNLRDLQVLVPKENILKKLVTFCPEKKADEVRNALFSAGAGMIGNYSECSFNAAGSGTFKAAEGADPYVGEIGERHYENEVRIEVIFPSYGERNLISALKRAHPYEEVAYDIYPLSNTRYDVGSGLTGTLEKEMSEEELLALLKKEFRLSLIRYTPLLGRKVRKVAVCGGAGSFLLGAAIAAGAGIYITSDVKYHEFFDADKKIVLADIGHYESEQFTIDLLAGILHQKFPNFAVLKTETNTNPVQYFT